MRACHAMLETMRTLSLVLTAAVALVACGPADSRSDASPISLGEVASSFALLDVNPASPRYGQRVSPPDYVGRVSAWYFGHST